MLDLLARLLALAPRLADKLARRPALARRADRAALCRAAWRRTRRARGAPTCASACSDADAFEAKLNAARRFQREEAFRIGVQVLEGVSQRRPKRAPRTPIWPKLRAGDGGRGAEEVERTHGAAARRFAVLALGKFGGRELAEGSDLDLMLVYDAPADAAAPARAISTPGSRSG